jgi:cytochrome c55X
VLGALLCAGAAVGASDAPVAAAIDAGRQVELRHLLDQDCGSCHGMTRKGGLGPALLPANLAGKPDELLIATILDGRPGTAMPPWRGQLTEAEAAWLVEQLRNGTD